MKRYHLLSIFLFVTTITFGQIDFKQVVPPNPNLASLFKSVITPVNEYSGLPNVSIPMHTIAEGNINIPISISYHTGGIQLSEEAGVVGLGWSLNAGGAITRSINGIDDFKPTYGYVNHNKNPPDLPVNGTLQFGYWRPDVQAFVESQNLINGENQAESCYYLVNNQATYFNLLPQSPDLDDFDYMQDQFYFNFNGYSGSFVFDNLGNPYLLEKQGLKIETIGTGSQGFRITTEDGTKYEFTAISQTYILAQTPQTYTSTWFLSTITDTSGNSAEFTYEAPNRLRAIPTFTQSFIADINTGVQTYSYAQNHGPITESDDVFINSILLKNSFGQTIQEVSMEYSSGELYNNPELRRDMRSRYLKKLKVYNMDAEVINSYDFSYTYFGADISNDPRNASLSNGDFASEVGAVTSEFPHLNLRLRLDTMTKNSTEEYAFNYFESNQTPNKTNMGQDYWGYYNGAINSNTFIPYAFDYGASAQSTIFDQEKKAYRLPSEEHAKNFSLKSITYPTKGKTEFNYELNTFDPDSNTGEFPIVTVPKSVRASKVSTPDSSNDTITEIITPKIGSVLKLTYNVTFTGWSTTWGNGIYADTKPPAPIWQDAFFVTFKDMQGNLMRAKYHIPSGNSEWFALTPEDNGNYNPNSIIQYQHTEEWYFDQNTTNQLEDEEYQITAHFNSNNGLYYGQADIHAEWDDALVDDTKQYSVGGGLRIASIEDFDNNGDSETKRQFNYHYLETQNDGSTVEKSYGKIKTMPNFTVSKIAVRNIGIKFNSYPPDWSPIPVANATSHNSFSKDAGSYVGYDQVEVSMIGSDGPNGKTVKQFFNFTDMFRPIVPDVVDQGQKPDSFHKFPPIRLPHNGKLKNETKYKLEGTNYIAIDSIAHQYQVNEIDAESFTLESLFRHEDRVISGIKELPIILVNTNPFGQGVDTYWYCENMYFHLYPHYSNLVQQTATIRTLFDQNGQNPITTTDAFQYENPAHYQLTRSTSTLSDGTVLETKTYYPDDISSATALPEGGTLENFNSIQQLSSNFQHRIATPVQITTKKDGKLLSVQRTEFNAFGQILNPWTNENDDIILPNKSLTAKGLPTGTSITPLENRLVYEDYLKGKPIQVRKQKGVPISYIWGYNNTYPIAKIENATYDAIATALGISPSILKTFDENDLAQINGLRAGHPEFMISTFTYQPLVGMISVTDPRGYLMTYEYDSNNRVKSVKDADGHLVTDYDYHYKGQN